MGCYSGLTDQGGQGDDAAASDDGVADEGSGSDTGSESGPQCMEIGGQPLRRISSRQYAQMLADLLPPALADEAAAVGLFPPTVIDQGFSTYAAANTVSTNESIQIEDNAEAIALLFYEGRAEYAPALMPCLSPGYGATEIDACIGEFVDDFGARAFRRPLTEGEHEIVMNVYDVVRDADGPEHALASVLHYFLQAPALLYVAERSDAPEEFAPLAPGELAARLALLFLDSAPDAELLQAVADGRLVTRDDVEREARRLVDRPEVARAFAQFHHEWMRGFVLEREERLHDLVDDAAQAGLREELRQFATWFLDESDGSFHTLMTTQSFPVEPSLAAIYATGEARTGVLTTAATMASHAHDSGTSLIERGAFVRTQVMCIPTPPFPGDIDIEGTLGDTADLPTARERLAPLMENPSCSGCHAGINPLGFPFEVYDWAGAYRATENGATIDASTDVALGSLQGSFANAAELIEAIAATEDARNCYATQWFRYALGRPEAVEDACVLEQIQAAFAAANGDVRELLVQIAISDAFLYRKTGEL